MSPDCSTIVRGRFPANDRATRDSAAFWEIFDRTMDEFFRTIDASKKYIQRLATQVADRDRKIELLEAQIDALRERSDLQLGPLSPPIRADRPARHGAAGGFALAEEEAAHEFPEEGMPAGDRPPGIWSRLTRLERAPSSSRRLGE
jgi:hypothetical protein